MAILRVGLNRTYKNIADAYFMAQYGDILLIDEGIYKEQITISDSKYVHLVGNTKDTSLGKVKIEPPNEAGSGCLVFSHIGITVTIYIEGINFKLPSLSTLEVVSALGCYNTNLVFNRCILNATHLHSYVFDCNSNGVTSIVLNNCNIIWKDDYVYGSSLARHFERSGRYVEYEINRCIFSNSIDNLDPNYFTLPSKIGPNELNTSNTVYSCSNTSAYMNDMYKFFDEMPNTTIPTTYNAEGDVLKFTTDFGEGSEKRIYYFSLLMADTEISKLIFYGSYDGVNWVEILYRNYTSLNYTFYLDEVYRYYRLDVTASDRYPSFYNYTLATENLDYTPFDYTLAPYLVNYGPYYGEYVNDVIDNYYIKGKVSDPFSKVVSTDTVTFDRYNGSDAIQLSNGYLTVSLPASYLNQHKAIKATVGKQTGKWYFEFRNRENYTANLSRVGFGTFGASNEYACGGSDAKSWALELGEGVFYHGNEVFGQISKVDYNSIVGVALDLNNNKAWFSVDGEWALEGNPSDGTNPIFTFDNTKLFPMVSLYNKYVLVPYVDVIFNPDDLTYNIPNGFEYYSESVKWKVNYYNANTNECFGYVYTDEEGDYKINTSYSGTHFLICKDASNSPPYDDLIYSNLIPKEYV